MSKQGTVTSWNTTRGYGFLQDDRGVDIFFHKSQAQGINLVRGKKVYFKPNIRNGKRVAENLTLFPPKRRKEKPLAKEFKSSNETMSLASSSGIPSYSGRKTHFIKNVCIIGGGPAGIGAGIALAEAGIKVTLVQEARGLGGRACTRMPKGRDNPLQFDFGVQMLRLRGPLQQKLNSLGVVQRWPTDPNRLVKLYAQGNTVVSRSPMEGDFYVGVPRMSLAFRVLAESARPNLKVVLDRSAVARKEGHKWNCSWKRSNPNYGQQKVRGNLAEGETKVEGGHFDAVILAFEALKIVQGCKSGYKRARPSATPRLRNEAKKIKHHQIRVLMLAFEESLGLDICGAEIHGHSRIRWIANNSSKPDRPDGPECWVIHSSILYGCKCEKNRIHKNEVTRTLKNDFFNICRDLGVDYFPRIQFSQYARWGACTSTTLKRKTNFVWDTENNMGGCGDWCKNKEKNDLYSRVCDAYESGIGLAKHIIATKTETTI